MAGWRKQKQNKAELCSKRGSDENVAGNRRAMRRSNSWGEATWELSSDPAKRVFESRGAEPPTSYPKNCQKHGPNQRLVIHVDASIKMTISGYSREGSGSRWWLMLVTREFPYISFLLTLLLLGTRRKSF